MVTAMRTRPALLTIFCLLALMMFSGCTSNPFGTSSSAQPGAEDFGSFTTKVGDFDDIEVPIDMKFVNDESMSIRTDSFEGGILTYTGRVEVNSLKQFMITALENKKWKMVGEAQSRKLLLAFTKPSKTCMVVFEEGFGGKYGYTKATLYITVDVASAGRLNPFGEPVTN